MKKYIYLLIVSTLPLLGFAQHTVTGTVTEKGGIAMPGVSVIIKGTVKGTTTDIDGNYTLKGVSSDDVLEYSFIGYHTSEEEVGIRSKINVELFVESSELEEVVLIGYGTAKRKDLTGSVAKVSSSDIAKTATPNFDQALSGRVSGVRISSTDGTPGEGLNITIRGGNSITGDNNPLYVIDGIPLEDFDPASISTSDIESFDILKDASATAIYGSRGANGVIIITTKEGRRDGKTDVRFNYTTGLQWAPNRLDVMGPYDFVKFQQQIAYALDNYSPGQYTKFFEVRWVDPELYKDSKGTNWQDEIFRIAKLNTYNVSLSGGNKTTNIYFSTEYIDQEGTLINTGFSKFVNNLKFSHKVTNTTKINGYLQYSRINRYGLKVSGNKYTSVIRDAVQFRPVEPVVDDGLDEGEIDINDPNMRYLYNPVKNLNNTDRQYDTDVIRGSLRLTQKIFDNLVLRLSGTYQSDMRKESVFFGKDTQQGTLGNDHINGSITHRRYNIISSSNTLNYKKAVKGNSLSVLGGVEFQIRDYSYSFLKNSELATDLLGINNIGLGVSPSVPQTYASGNSLLSYFGRVNYNYKQRYLVTATYRADGSSKFKPENRWGFFPSFSVAWNISNEKFLKRNKIISNAKLRAGWGLTGNNRVGDFDAYTQLSANSKSGYVWGNGEQYHPGVYVSNLGVPDLRWETTAQANIGLNLGLFHNRISTTIDLYRKRTTDLLLNAEMALHTGFDKVQQNIGEVENKGLELSINSTNIRSGAFTWSTTFNIAFNKNKTIVLNKGQEAIYTDPEWNASYAEYQYITKVGQPVGMIYGLQYDGIYQMDDFNWDNKYQNGVLKPGVPDNGTLPVAPGSVKFVDQNGDGTINSDDRVIIGNPQPKHFGGFINDFTYGNFDCQILLEWSYGNDILNANRAVYEVPTARQNMNGFQELVNGWTPLNNDTDINTIRYNTTFGAPPKGNQVDSRYVEDGSYLKLRSVTLGYTFDQESLKKLKMQKLRLYVSGQNLFTWTNYTGFDPDVSVGRYGALTPGLDYSAYPQSATVMGGIEITF